MNLTSQPFALVKEMLETPGIIAGFDFTQTRQIADAVQSARKLLFTGEGSSRIFPAKSFIAEFRLTSPACGGQYIVATEGSRQSAEYDLSGWTVVAASNSGQTAETIPLFAKLQKQNHPHRFAVTANPQAKLLEYATAGIVLRCGKEQAVAATKSVVEQTLVYRSLLPYLVPEIGTYGIQAAQASRSAQKILDTEYDAGWIKKLAAARHIYFAGRNDGVAEELALKTIEITRKKSAYFEGTYLLHGAEEMIENSDAIVLIEPFEEECQRIQERYVDALKVPVLAVSSKPTVFPTIIIPSAAGYDTILQLLAGWNLLVQIGIANGIDIDKPVRARKIGNEWVNEQNIPMNSRFYP